VDRVSPKVLALLALLTLVWGTNWPMFKIALTELPVLTFRSITMLTAFAVLTAILMVRGESFAVPKGKWPALIAASAMNILVWNIATSLAVLYIPSGHASVLAYTMPLWVALLGFAVFGQRLTGRLFRRHPDRRWWRWWR
jgi:drug/metabolite transporter (DMT)-like permease